MKEIARIDTAFQSDKKMHLRTLRKWQVVIEADYRASIAHLQSRSNADKKTFAKEMHDKYELTKRKYFDDFPDPKHQKSLEPDEDIELADAIRSKAK